jgi:hypothetical protein
MCKVFPTVHPNDFREGRYICHAVDNFILDLLSILCKRNIISSFIPMMTDEIKELIMNIVDNGTRILACTYYIYALGMIRFTRYQRNIVIYDSYMRNEPCTLERSIFALQIGILLFDVDSILSLLFNTFKLNLNIELFNKENRDQPIGLQFMIEYWIIVVMNIAYNRTYIIHDKKVFYSLIFLRIVFFTR